MREATIGTARMELFHNSASDPFAGFVCAKAAIEREGKREKEIITCQILSRVSW